MLCVLPHRAVLLFHAVCCAVSVSVCKNLIECSKTLSQVIKIDGRKNWTEWVLWSVFGLVRFCVWEAIKWNAISTGENGFQIFHFLFIRMTACSSCSKQFCQCESTINFHLINSGLRRSQRNFYFIFAINETIKCSTFPNPHLVFEWKERKEPLYHRLPKFFETSAKCIRWIAIWKSTRRSPTTRCECGGGCNIQWNITWPFHSADMHIASNRFKMLLPAACLKIRVSYDVPAW